MTKPTRYDSANTLRENCLAAAARASGEPKAQLEEAARLAGLAADNFTTAAALGRAHPEGRSYWTKGLRRLEKAYRLREATTYL